VSDDRIWVMMAWDGPRHENAESWHPVAVFVGENPPGLMARGRMLFAAHRQGQLPWDHPRGDGGRWNTGVRIGDVTSLEEIPAALVAAQAEYAPAGQAVRP